jgi:hypothetical protein
MTDSNSPPGPANPAGPATPRATLKLKGAPRKPAEEVKAPVAPRPPAKPNAKPGAHWSDEYKRRMQADMDELTGK